MKDGIARRVAMLGPVIATCIFAGGIVVVGRAIVPVYQQQMETIEQVDVLCDKIDHETEL